MAHNSVEKKQSRVLQSQLDHLFSISQFPSFHYLKNGYVIVQYNHAVGNNVFCKRKA